MITEALRQLNAFTSVSIVKLRYLNFSCLPAVGTQGWSLAPDWMFSPWIAMYKSVLENCWACPCGSVGLC